MNEKINIEEPVESGINGIKDRKYLKAPFPYFGGKSLIADRVWELLGDVKMYIEPFFVSSAVLANRPQTKHRMIYEIINDQKGHLCNIWRSIRYSPEETVRWSGCAVNQADIPSVMEYLLEQEPHLVGNLFSNIEWHDSKLAGFWIGLEMIDSGSKSLQFSDRDIQEWILAFSRRFRHVKTICGRWNRVCGGNWQQSFPSCGIFFDPFCSVSFLKKKIYRTDSSDVKDIEEWALKKMEYENVRIVFCGRKGEYPKLLDAGWQSEPWRDGLLFFSPSCIQKTTNLLFEKEVRDGEDWNEGME